MHRYVSSPLAWSALRSPFRERQTNPHDFDSAEDYADACLQNVDLEQRAAFLEAQIPESDWRNCFIDEYYDMLDAESGEVERENAEIEARLMHDRGVKFN